MCITDCNDMTLALNPNTTNRLNSMKRKQTLIFDNVSSSCKEDIKIFIIQIFISRVSRLFLAVFFILSLKGKLNVWKILPYFFHIYI